MVSLKKVSNNKAASWGRKIFFALLASWATRCAAVTEKQTAAVTWNASPDTNVIGYAVYYGTSNGIYTTRIDAGTNNTVTVANLTPGANYYFIVTAYDAGGMESPPSNQITVSAPVTLHLKMAANASAPNTLQFMAASGHSYAIMVSSDLQNWTSLWSSGVAASDGWLQYQDFDHNQFQRFYRVVVH